MIIEFTMSWLQIGKYNTKPNVFYLDLIKTMPLITAIHIEPDYENLSSDAGFGFYVRDKDDKVKTIKNIIDFLQNAGALDIHIYDTEKGWNVATQGATIEEVHKSVEQAHKGKIPNLKILSCGGVYPWALRVDEEYFNKEE